MNLGSISTRTKIFIVLFILAATTISISTIAYFGMSAMRSATHGVDHAGKQLHQAGEIIQHALELNRAEYSLAANPHEVKEHEAEISNWLKSVDHLITNLKSDADNEQLTALNAIAEGFKRYEKDLGGTIKLAKQYADSVVLADEQKELLQAVVTSRLEMDLLTKKLDDYSKLADNEASRLAHEADTIALKETWAMVAISAFGIILGLIIGYAISEFGIVKPIRRLVATLEALAGGDLNIDVPGCERADEMGDVARTTLVFKDNLKRTRQLEAEAMETQLRSEEARRQSLRELADRFDASVGTIVNDVAAAATQMQGSAQTLSAMAEQTNTQSISVSASSQQTTSNVQAVASATEELSATIQEVSAKLQETSTMATGAATEVEQTNEAVHSLQAASQKINTVVKLIQDIAEQTNLLALNATIEAARAGEAGRGFAVVANEVKHLASQTAQATEEISQQIGDMQSAAEHSSKAIDSIGNKILAINEAMSAIASAAEEQNTATHEISRNVQEAANGTQTVSDSIIDVRDAAQATGETSTSVLSAATTLTSQATTLRSEVDKFLETVRAA